MQRATVDGHQLVYELRGAGEPVVLIHWGLCAPWAEPLMDEPSLADRHRLLSYHRVGFGGSDAFEGALTMADHAAHCAGLLDVLGIERAHIVGHSSSALIGLQLALDFPDTVQTLTLMEPARPVPPTEDQAEFARDFVAPALHSYGTGDKAAAVDTFARGVFGPDWRGRFEARLPGAFEQAVADADAFFGQELPALQEWSLTEADASRILHPTLAVMGADTVPTFPGRIQLLASWLPNVELVELPDTTHLLHLEHPRRTAEALSAFYARHALNPESGPS
jgi:3-oxoadipate enol-lactonase